MKSKFLSVLIFLAVTAASVKAQTQVNPASQINWPVLTGTTAPTQYCPTATTGSIVSGSASVTLASTSGVFTNQVAVGAGIPTATSVVSINSTTRVVTLSQAATVTASGVNLYFSSYGMPYTNLASGRAYTCTTAGWTAATDTVYPGVTSDGSNGLNVAGTIVTGTPIATSSGGTGSNNAVGALQNLGGVALSPALSGAPSVLASPAAPPTIAGMTTLPDGALMATYSVSSVFYQQLSFDNGVTWQPATAMPTPTGGYSLGYVSLNTLSNGTVFESGSMGNGSQSVSQYNVGTIQNPITSYAAGAYAAAINTDPSGNLWVSNLSGNSVQKFSYSAGSWSLTWTYSTSLSSPNGVAFDTSGNGYVLNTGSSTITELSTSGALVKTITIATLASGCLSPASIAVDGGSNIVVACSGTLSGVNVYAWTNAGTAIAYSLTASTQPNVLVVVPSGVATYAGYLYVASSSAATVTVVNVAHSVVGTFPGVKGAQAITTDSSGNAWIAGALVAAISPVGATVNAVYTGGSIYGLTFDADGYLWTSAYNSGYVKKWNTTTGAYLGGFPVGAGPQGMATDTHGNVWSANSAANSISKIPATSLPDTISWAGYTQIPISGQSWCYPSAGMVQVSSLIYILPVWCAANGTGSNTPFSSGILRSTNSGSTWAYTQLTAAVTSGYVITDDYDETTGQLMLNGDVVLIARHEGLPSGDPYGTYARFVSHDSGVTWSGPVDVLSVANPGVCAGAVVTGCPIAGKPSLALDTTGNLYFVGRGAIAGSYSEHVASISHDEGSTWTAPVDLTLAGNRDNYDALTLMANGAVSMLQTAANPSQVSFSQLLPNGIPIPVNTNFGTGIVFSNPTLTGVTVKGFGSVSTAAGTTGDIWDFLQATPSATTALAGYIVPGTSTSVQFGAYKSTINTAGFVWNCTSNFFTRVQCGILDPFGNLTVPGVVKSAGAQNTLLTVAGIETNDASGNQGTVPLAGSGPSVLSGSVMSGPATVTPSCTGGTWSGSTASIMYSRTGSLIHLNIDMTTGTSFCTSTTGWTNIALPWVTSASNPVVQVITCANTNISGSMAMGWGQIMASSTNLAIFNGNSQNIATASGQAIHCTGDIFTQ